MERPPEDPGARGEAHEQPSYGPSPPTYWPGPPGYGPPQGPFVQVKTNGFAVASLVLGILWLYWVGSILALIFGMLAKSQIDGSGGTQGGRGMAIAGIVLGWVGIGFLVLMLLFFGLAGCGAAVSS